MDFEDYTLDALSVAIWEALLQGSRDRGHAFHTPAVANVSGGQPRVRTVVLRHVDAENHLLTFHTDGRSQKVADLEHDNRLQFLFYDPEAQLQLTIDTEASIHQDDTIADAAWKASPALSRRCYLSHYAPGTQLQQPESGLPETVQSRRPETAETEAGRPNFAVVTCRATDIHALCLKATGNLAAQFQYDGGRLTAMSWVAP